MDGPTLFRDGLGRRSVAWWTAAGVGAMLVTYAALRSPRQQVSPGSGAKLADDSSGALNALYQSEKADASAIFNVSMAMMGIAAAYVVGAISLAEKYGSDSIPWSVVVLLPAPLWVIVVFHSLITLNAMNHGLSVLILEDKLFRKSQLPRRNRVRQRIGSEAGDQVMDIMKSHWAHKAATAFCYAGVGFLVIGYTTYDVIKWWPHGGSGWRIVVLSLYSLSFLVAATSWIAGLWRLKKAQGIREELSPRFP